MNEKEKLIKMLDDMINRFDVDDQNDYNNLILLLTNMLILGENDHDIISRIRIIAEKATSYNKSHEKCYRNNRDADKHLDNSALTVAEEEKFRANNGSYFHYCNGDICDPNFMPESRLSYVELPDVLKNMISYRVVCYDSRTMNYMVGENDD